MGAQHDDEVEEVVDGVFKHVRMPFICRLTYRKGNYHLAQFFPAEKSAKTYLPRVVTHPAVTPMGPKIRGFRTVKGAGGLARVVHGYPHQWLPWAAAP